MNDWDKCAESISRKIRIQVEKQLEHVQQKIVSKTPTQAFLGAKTTVFKEFAELVIREVELDEMVQMAVTCRFKVHEDHLQQQTQEYVTARKKYEAMIRQEAEKLEVDPEHQRQQRFLKVLDHAVPMPEETRSAYNGTYQQALRSRGMALAAFCGLRCVGGGPQSEDKNREQPAKAERWNAENFEDAPL